MAGLSGRVVLRADGRTQYDHRSQDVAFRAPRQVRGGSRVREPRRLEGIGLPDGVPNPREAYRREMEVVAQDHRFRNEFLPDSRLNQSRQIH